MSRRGGARLFSLAPPAVRSCVAGSHQPVRCASDGASGSGRRSNSLTRADDSLGVRGASSFFIRNGHPATRRGARAQHPAEVSAHGCFVSCARAHGSGSSSRAVLCACCTMLWIRPVYRQSIISLAAARISYLCYTFTGIFCEQKL